jgi:hypothetical protein
MHPHLLMPGMWLPGVVGSSASFIGQQEQWRTSAQRTNKQDEVGELASRLTAFYLKYNPAKLDSVAEVSRNFVGKEQELNDALMRKYKKDLKSMVGASILSAPIDQAQTVSNYLQAFFGELVLDNLWILESFLGSLIEYTLDRKRHSYQNPLSKEQFSPQIRRQDRL